MRTELSRTALVGVRGLIDGLDDALLALLAGRRRLVALAAGIKRDSGQALRDPARERQVRLRARRLGRRLGLPPDSSDRLIAALIQDACGQQGLPASTAEECPPTDLDQCADGRQWDMLATTMRSDEPTAPRFPWLRWLPPPARLGPLLRRMPPNWQAMLLETAMRRVLAAALDGGALDPLRERRLGIEISDLGMRWVVVLREGQMQVCLPDEPAEATVRGTATDLLLLASRREDADTLFFQRRLVLTGDTELGLTARNLLDQLPWQDVPLGLRIALHRGAGLAQAARAAHRGRAASD